MIMNIKLEAKDYFYEFSLKGKQTCVKINQAGKQAVEKIKKIIALIIRFISVEATLAKSSRRAINRMMKRTGADYIHLTGKKDLTIFIHGFMSNETAFIDYDEQFENRCSFLRVNLSNTFRGIEDCALEILAKIENLYHDDGPLEINLVGHSMGGIIAAEFAERFQSEKFIVKNVVAIGSPFKGTDHASEIPFIKSASQMQPNSPFLKRLVNQMKENKHVAYHFAASDFDPIVPRDSSLPFGKNHYLLSEFAKKGHLCLLSDQGIKDWVIRCLGILDTSPY